MTSCSIAGSRALDPVSFTQSLQVFAPIPIDIQAQLEVIRWFARLRSDPQSYSTEECAVKKPDELRPLRVGRLIVSGGLMALGGSLFAPTGVLHLAGLVLTPVLDSALPFGLGWWGAVLIVGGLGGSLSAFYRPLAPPSPSDWVAPAAWQGLRPAAVERAQFVPVGRGAAGAGRFSASAAVNLMTH